METIGNHRQVPMPFMGTVQMRQADPAHVALMSDVGAVRHAVQASGLDDYEIAQGLSISAGYMSKVLHGTAGLHGKRLVQLMRLTGSLAPLQWLAEQMGCEVVQRNSQAARIAALEAELAQARRAA